MKFSLSNLLLCIMLMSTVVVAFAWRSEKHQFEQKLNEIRYNLEYGHGISRSALSTIDIARYSKKNSASDLEKFLEGNLIYHLERIFERRNEVDESAGDYEEFHSADLAGMILDVLECEVPNDYLKLTLERNPDWRLLYEYHDPEDLNHFEFVKFLESAILAEQKHQH